MIKGSVPMREAMQWTILKGLVILVLIVLILMTYGCARASELWGTATFASYHLDRTKGYNERNLGVGIQYRTSTHWRWVAGGYDNSFNRTTLYAGAGYFTETLVQLLSVNVKLGAIVAAVTGYGAHATGAVLPTLSFEKSGFELGVGYIPKIDHKTSAVVTGYIGKEF